MSQLTHAVRRRPRRAQLTAAAVLVALAALLLVWIGRASADANEQRAALTVSNVATGRADALEFASFDCTTSDSFADMPGTSETFSFGGTASRPALVLFQGQWEGNGGAVIRLTIDGAPQSLVVPVYRSGFGTNGFHFISAPLAPGTHTAKIQWSSDPTVEGAICVLARSLIILHK